MRYMEYEALMDMVKTEAYKEIDYAYENGGTFQECKMYGDDLSSVFDDLVNKLGRPPTCREYVDEGMVRCQSFWTNRTHRVFGMDLFKKWNWNNPILQDACTTRLIRTYKSKMVEYSTLSYLQSKTDVLVGEHPYMDLWLGVDIVVASPYYNVVTYLHVTTERSNIMNKESRGSGKWHGKGAFVRDFSRNHMTLGYATKTTSSTFYVNSIPFLEPDYIDDVINSTFIDPIGEYDTMLGENTFSELRRLNKHVREQIDPDGISNVWLNKDAVFHELKLTK